jgi:cell wall hydrolase
MLAILAFAPPASARRLAVGMHGVDVEHLQERLAQLSYLPKDGASGQFDERTWHAVVAFQGWQGIAPDGLAGDTTRQALRRASPPLPASGADGLEVHLLAQVLLIVRHGHTTRAVHVSTGAGGRTPPGHFSISSRSPMSWSKPFQTWLPLAQYFNGGIALHQYPSVPAFPASHGCVRIPLDDAQVVWDAGEVGMRLWVTDDDQTIRIKAIARARWLEQRRHARLLGRALTAMSLNRLDHRRA